MKKHNVCSAEEGCELGDVVVVKEDVGKLLRDGQSRMEGSNSSASHTEEVVPKHSPVESLQLPGDVFTPFDVPQGAMEVAAEAETGTQIPEG